MKYIKSTLNWLLDNVLAWFTPSWRRNGREAIAALRRYANYNRHCLNAELLEKCATRKTELQAALQNWDKEECVRIVKLLAVECDGMPGFKRSAAVEMVESFFVIMVIFLGLRTYYVQPFRIPTGSMQPSLNGIILHPVDEVPGLLRQGWDMLTLGSSYIDATADTRKALDIRKIEDHPKYLLFTETTLTFEDGSKVNIPSAKGAVLEYLIKDWQKKGKLSKNPDGTPKSIVYSPGETIVRAKVDAGDMILVNRVAYHFRQPRRGETFVFDTRGINTDMQQPSQHRMTDQQNGTHYIKRLCGLPGDKLKIEPPHLIVNGKEAQEATIKRVAACQPPYNKEGYQQIMFRACPQAHMHGSSEMVLNKTSDPTMREYAAFGDNTTNSLDSRYWGPVRQFNIIGPASFALWPFTSHWGNID